jgi:hypothetical protein
VGVPGAAGTTPGAITFAAEDAPEPRAFVAATVIEYVVPVVRLDNLHVSAVVAHVTVVPPVTAAVAV